MDAWHFEPARDLGLSGAQRRRSLLREVGLESAISCFLWRTITRMYLAIAHRLEIHGRNNLPARPPFVLVANHASHLDAVVLGAILPARFVGAVFPIAAGDTFFTKPASSIFATACMNALPIWRKNCGAHSLEDLRERLAGGECVYILFPEGTRTRTGEMENSNPASADSSRARTFPLFPVICAGRLRRCRRRGKFRIGKKSAWPLASHCRLQTTTNDRAGWESIAETAENAVRFLADKISAR